MQSSTKLVLTFMTYGIAQSGYGATQTDACTDQQVYNACVSRGGSIQPVIIYPAPGQQVGPFWACTCGTVTIKLPVQKTFASCQEYALYVNSCSIQKR